VSDDDDDVNAEPAKLFVIDIELLLLLRRRRALLAHLPPPRIKAPHKHHRHERFSSFVNAVSLNNRTRTDIGVFHPPSVCDDWSYTTIRSNWSRFLNIVISFVGALAMFGG
jgi:hypothetical protein